MAKDKIRTSGYSALAFCHFAFLHRLSQSQILIQHLKI